MLTCMGILRLDRERDGELDVFVEKGSHVHPFPRIKQPVFLLTRSDNIPCQEARPKYPLQEGVDEKNYEIVKRRKEPGCSHFTPNIIQCHHRFFAAPMCVPCTLLPNRRLLLLSCQCAASGDRCNIMSVRLDLPLAAVPPSEDWRR